MLFITNDDDVQAPVAAVPNSEAVYVRLAVNVLPILVDVLRVI